jgi:hypothetical protein
MGICPGYIANKIFQLRGTPSNTLVWPSQLSKLEPLLLTENKKKLLSSGLADSLLAQVRGVLLCLQQKGHPDLILADVPRITNHWMKNTGASDAASRGVPEWLRNGQGRWGLLSQEPKMMVRKYMKSALEEKLSTSDIGVQWCSAKIVSGPVPHSTAQLSSDSDYSQRLLVSEGRRSHATVRGPAALCGDWIIIFSIFWMGVGALW